MRHKGGHAVLGSEFQVQGGIRQITEHGAGRRIFSSSSSIEEGIANNIATNENGIKNVVHARQHVSVGDQGRINRYSYSGGQGLSTFSLLASPFSLFYDSQQLNRVTQFRGELDIE